MLSNSFYGVFMRENRYFMEKKIKLLTNFTSMTKDKLQAII